MMKLLQNPFRTTIRGVKNNASVRATVRQIQEKIMDYGVCSDDEHEYLRTHSDWDRLNPKTPSNFG